MSYKLFLKFVPCALLWGLITCSGLEAPMIDTDQDADMTPVDMASDLSEPMHGDACRVPSDCGAALICAGNGSRFQCMKRCDAPGTRCQSGEVCTGLDVGGGQRDAVCYLGGETARGEPCNTNLECEAGNLCFGDGTARYCLEACHAATPECTQAASRCVLAAGDQSAGYCQPTLGGSCDVSQDCQGSSTQLVCSLESGQDMQLLRQLFPSPACTETGCVSDGACGPRGRCAGFMQSTGATSACVRTCSRDSECRFQVEERCWRASDCEGRGDEASCRALLEGGRLCLPGGLTFFWP